VTKCLLAGNKWVKLSKWKLNSVSQSYLTVWSNDFKEVVRKHKITDTISSRYFTPALLAIALLAFGYWMFIDTNTAFNVFTAVLIVACPCALALIHHLLWVMCLRILANSNFILKTL
jgi:Cu+-exporting ATPase